MEKKFIVYLPGGTNKKLNNRQKIWLKENSDCEIKHTSWYRCGFLNFLESKRYDKRIMREMSE